jgi:hypothetical protein
VYALAPFTAGLVAGLLTGDADADGDGFVSVKELADFAGTYVKATTSAQTPTLTHYSTRCGHRAGSG